MQFSGQKAEEPDASLLSHEKWGYAHTELRHVERVKQALLPYGLDVVDMTFVLTVIDGHGLFHEPIPAPKQTSKEIRRAAKAAANRLRRRMMGIRAGRIAATDVREARLAEEWPQLGPAALQMEEEKLRCTSYQTMRGGRIVPVGRYANRRPEGELTHALLMVDYHLEQTKHWPHPQRMSCLTSVVIAVQDLREDTIIVSARVRERLREAKKNQSLHIWNGEYLDLLSGIVATDEMQEMMDRQKQFGELMWMVHSSELCEPCKEEAAARLGPSFRVF